MDQFDEKFPKKLLLGSLYIFSMTVLAFILSIIIIIILQITNPGQDKENEAIANAVINFTIYLTLFVTFIILMGQFYKKQMVHFQKYVVYFVLLAISGWLFSIFLNVIIEMGLDQLGYPMRESVNQGEIEKAMKYWYLMIPMVVIFAPVVEETVFRGVLFNFAKELRLPFNLNLVLAFILSSTIFGLIHVVPAAITKQDLSELVLGIPYIMTGLVLTIIYYLSKNIYVSMIAHFMQNLMGVIVMLIQQNLPDLFPSTDQTQLYYLLHLFLPIR